MMQQYVEPGSQSTHSPRFLTTVSMILPVTSVGGGMKCEPYIPVKFVRL